MIQVNGVCPHTFLPIPFNAEEEMIKIENIRGKLIMIGADDDSLWEAGKYVRRMDQRLQKYPHECEAARKDIDKRLSTALYEWIAV